MGSNAQYVILKVPCPVISVKYIIKPSRQNVHRLEWIMPNLGIGPAPRSQAHIEDIKKKGIDAVLNLCAECYDLHEIEVVAHLVIGKQTPQKFVLKRPETRGKLRNR